MGAIAAGIAAAGAALATGYGNGLVISHTVDSMARQPQIASQLRTTMFIGVGLIEGVPILAIVVAFLVMNK
ncbi:ATP synthase F0, C subunit [Limosilactobacillus coleohominis 101-4-CHN]|uniref:ATP synthase subunit c n=1 Tax=Limosilactobacillus coleohominis 101-4-CHN TaxID=575594 RepID=C7XWP9_9LACO|nr:F0F1 ATP synthase subunit C [Limosilactobacillus coleohominis]EEU30047.1 ATP synthase F0, C subunit [Limosilactobacillus coleohominis 101-4-CHN]